MQRRSGLLTWQVALVLLVSAAFSAAGWAQNTAGRVDFVTGKVTATGKDRKVRTLAKGDLVFEGDTVATAADRIPGR
ncbi:MAG: hypothetical protein HYY79_08460 [Betaproteobacteria bacterium]|nr:hypothetical protein [Betaproteobacteria bacterium]